MHRDALHAVHVRAHSFLHDGVLLLVGPGDICCQSVLCDDGACALAMCFLYDGISVHVAMLQQRSVPVESTSYAFNPRDCWLQHARKQDLMLQYVCVLPIASCQGFQAHACQHSHHHHHHQHEAHSAASSHSHPASRVQESDLAAFDQRLDAARWGLWALDVTAKPREYKGAVSQRINVRAARPLSWADDCANLLRQIAARGGAASAAAS